MLSVKRSKTTMKIDATMHLLTLCTLGKLFSRQHFYLTIATIGMKYVILFSGKNKKTISLLNLPRKRRRLKYARIVLIYYYSSVCVYHKPVMLNGIGPERASDP